MWEAVFFLGIAIMLAAVVCGGLGMWGLLTPLLAAKLFVTCWMVGFIIGTIGALLA